MRIIIGSDHAGYALKEAIKAEFTEHKFVDVGTDTEDSVDYPDYAHAVCTEVLADDECLGILVCGTGIGMSIAANKHRGIRAALCTSSFMCEMTRKHNNANILCLGARVTDGTDALEIVKTFLTTEFEGGRHQIRVSKIDV